MRRWGWGLLLVQALLGCGPEAALWVRVEAPLRVPEECDSVLIRVTRQEGGTEVESYRRTYPLDGATQQFPLTLLLTADDSSLVGVPLRVEATALRGEARARDWSHGGTRARLTQGELGHAVLTLCETCGED